MELHCELYGFTCTKIRVIPVLYDPGAQPDIPGGKRIQGFLAAASRNPWQIAPLTSSVFFLRIGETSRLAAFRRKCHTKGMARGWESKDVESQVEAAEARAALAKLTKLTAEEVDRKGQLESLRLSRKRVLHDIETSKNPGYRATLEAALKHLDDKIALLS
jgi:hypothetical protein